MLENNITNQIICLLEAQEVLDDFIETGDRKGLQDWLDKYSEEINEHFKEKEE